MGKKGDADKERGDVCVQLTYLDHSPETMYQYDVLCLLGPTPPLTFLRTAMRWLVAEDTQAKGNCISPLISSLRSFFALLSGLPLC